MGQTEKDEERTINNNRDAVRNLIVLRKETGKEEFGVESAW